MAGSLMAFPRPGFAIPVNWESYSSSTAPETGTHPDLPRPGLFTEHKVARRVMGLLLVTRRRWFPDAILGRHMRPGNSAYAGQFYS
jgi:hypothetical protein